MPDTTEDRIARLEQQLRRLRVQHFTFAGITAASFAAAAIAVVVLFTGVHEGFEQAASTEDVSAVLGMLEQQGERINTLQLELYNGR